MYAACARKGKGTSDFRSVSVVQVILSREGHTSVESIWDYKVMTILLRRIETHRKLNGHIEQYTPYWLLLSSIIVVGAGAVQKYDIRQFFTEKHSTVKKELQV